MRNNIKILLILLMYFVPHFSLAQNTYIISGTVENKDTKEKVPLVAIQLKELGRWTTSDMLGEFNFKNIPAGTYTFQASCLGFEKYEKVITTSKDVLNYKLRLTESSLGLEEVTIVAKENTSLSSSSKIENTAIEHVQPTNLADVMQLVPGQITLNPDMSTSNQISIRDINTEYDPDDNSALGTAIIIDGTPIDNDANMQSLNTASSGTSQGYSTAGQGVDLRSISTDNIESVEVIRGIPSVEYGDLTTGAVIVKTKAGKSKVKVKIKADPKIKQLAFSKGLLLSRKKGAVNLDMDYTHSFNDLRKPSKSFKRITSQFGYSNTLFKETRPLSLNLKVNYSSTFDNEKNDPDQLQKEIERQKQENIDIKLYGKWSVQKPWLSNISYNLSSSFKKQEYYEYKATSNNGAKPIPTAYESGESIGVLLPSEYYSELTIDGRPYNYFGVIKANIIGKYGRVNNNLMYGADWRTSGNNGEGQIYDITRPPSAATSTRPRAFKDVPASHKLALFVEDKITIPLGTTKLSTQAGIRYNNLMPKGLFSTDGFITFEPRINTTYNIIDNKKNNTLKTLSLRFGYGITSKTPTMLHLYPDKSYKDELSFNYSPDLIVISTEVTEDTSNPDLKPITNTKFETGIDFNIKGIKCTVTGFKESIENGFSWESQYFKMEYRKWDQLEVKGLNPVFENGNITYTQNGETNTLDYENQSEFNSYKTPVNTYNINKKGIEYVINFGRIQSIHTNLIIDGAYFHINRIENVLPFTESLHSTYLGKKYPYVTVYPGGKGSTTQRFNSNFKITTQIPKLKMLISLNTQLIWMDKSANYWKDDDKNAYAYSLTESNEKLYGNYEDVDKIYVDPVGFYDLDMVYHNWQDSYNYELPYASMIKTLDSDYFETNSYPFLWQINLKLTKEFNNGAKLSFFANNLFNHRPLHKNTRTGSYLRRNQTAYFGAELKFNL